MSPLAFLWVGLGGALGSIARFGIGLWALRAFGAAFPCGTLGIKITGSFVIGFFGILSSPGGVMPTGESARLFVMVGICGGFTTFSTFSLQTLGLLETGQGGRAAAYVAISVAGSVLGVWLGVLGAQALNGGFGR